jgi:uncharacterized membrane protein YcaP (DUF421 family)
MLNHNFDWYAIFFGDDVSSITTLLEIVFRTIFMYGYTLINIRFIGKRSIKYLNAFELVVIIALSAAVGNPMLYPSVPLAHGMCVISVMVLLEVFAHKFTAYSGLASQLFLGSPTMVIKYGKVLQDTLEDVSIPEGELFARLRINGIEYVSEVKYGFLETNGKLSTIKYKYPRKRQIATFRQES